MTCDDNKSTTHLSMDYQEIVCSIHSDALLQKHQSVLNDYLHFCSVQLLVLSAIDANKKQLHLSGTKASIAEASKRREEFNRDSNVDFRLLRKTISRITKWSADANDEKEINRRNLLVVRSMGCHMAIVRFENDRRNWTSISKQSIKGQYSSDGRLSMREDLFACVVFFSSLYSTKLGKQ